MIDLSKRLADVTIGELRELTHALSAMPCGSDTDTLGLVIGFVEPAPAVVDAPEPVKPIPAPVPVPAPAAATVKPTK